MRIIAMARQLDQAPEQIVIFGIQPERIEPGQTLSRTLTDKMDEYISTILRELEKQSCAGDR